VNLHFNTAFGLIWRLFLLSIGALISALGVVVFQAPFDIAPGGITGVGVILNHLFGLPIGLIILVGNIPVQLLAFRMLGGWRVIARTVFAVVLYSLLIDLITPYYAAGGTVSDDRLLNALFGGIVGGIGTGLVLRAGGTMGGTSTLGRILQQRYGIPLSSSTLYTDGAVIAVAGLVFGWEGALYAMVSLFVGGATADYTLEGPSVIRTSIIITDHPRDVADAILAELGRGVTAWEGQGMFTEQPHSVLYVTIARSQVNALRRIVTKTDPTAFLVIGQGHTAYGRGFREIRAAKQSEG
jgi:uncharacterized membrane-anchored protein YitT (DUF2179 family)